MKKFTRRSLVTAAALILIAAGAIGCFAITRSGLAFESQEYDAEFYLNHLQVHLIENGRDVCGGVNTLDGSEKVTGNLCEHLGFESMDKLGSFEPGMMYGEEIAARNSRDIPVYLRMTVRKYWIDKESGEKITTLSPSLIGLKYGKSAYNDAAWAINDEESTAESGTYYYRSELAPGEDSSPLFDSLVIDKKIADKYEEKLVSDKDGVKKYEYVYEYDNSAFIIQADVQAIQTHNANDAIMSQWGVSNVTASDGSLTVR